MNKPPKTLSAVFLLTCLKLVISFVFFGVITSKGDNPALAQMILYTSLAYVGLAIPTFIFIHKRFGVGVRFMIVLALLSGLPVKAFIGIGIDFIALALTFSKPAKEFFSKREA